MRPENTRVMASHSASYWRVKLGRGSDCCDAGSALGEALGSAGEEDVVVGCGSISISWRKCRPGKHLSRARKRTSWLVMPGGTGWPGVFLRSVGLGAGFANEAGS